MSYRSLNSTLQTSLINGDAYGYAHLIKFEKPIPATELNYRESEKSSNRAINYTYLTDGSYDIKFNDGTSDLDGNPNGEQNYLANKVLKVGTASETIQAKSTGMNLVLASDAVGISLAGSFVFTSTEVTAPSGTTWTDYGFQEGDSVQFEGSGANNGAVIRIDSFTTSNTKAKFTVLPKDDGTVSSIASQTATYTASYHSPEINALTTLKSDPSFSSYLNREVFIYRAHINPSTGAIIGGNDGVFLLFKGIITGGKMKDDPLKGSTISWNLTSHWGDFVQVVGRSTSNSAHRGLDTSGVPVEDAVFRPEYANDLAFSHSEQAINVSATYQTEVERYGTRRKSGVINGGLLGIEEGYTYMEMVDKDVDLEFNLQARYIPIVYGVQKISGLPFFADGDKDNPARVYMAHALAEGPCHSILDIHIDDNPLICTNTQDIAERFGADKDAKVLCVGRADKGDVLLGGNERIDPSSKTQYQDILDEIEDLQADLDKLGSSHRNNNQRNDLRAQIGDLQAEKGAFNEVFEGNTGQAGLVHEKKFTYSFPMETHIVFHGGYENQEADARFSTLGQQGKFKIQDMYYSDNPKGQYWGEQHRALDTCYVAAQYDVNDTEFTVPKADYILKGKIVDCFNYDRSYNGTGTHTQFALGDYVKIFGPDSARLYDGTNTNETVQIIDKFSFYNEKGTLEYRYRFSKNLHLKEDNSNLTADKKNFYMESLTNSSHRFYFVAYDARISKQDGSGAIEGLTLGTNTSFTSSSNSTIAFADRIFYGVTIKNGLGQNVTGRKMVNFPTGNSILSFGKKLGFKLNYGHTCPGYQEYFEIPYTYNSSNGEVNFSLGDQGLARTIENFFDRVGYTTGATWEIAVVDVITLAGSLGTSNDVYNKSLLEIERYNSARNRTKFERTIDDYDASLNGVRLNRSMRLSHPAFSSNIAQTFKFSITGSLELDTAAWNSVRDKNSDKRVTLNPAMQLLDYLTNARYGRGLDIDTDIELDSFLSSARFCDSRSDVTMIVKKSTLTTTPTAGAVYKYPSTGDILFQGKVKSVSDDIKAVGLGDTSETTFKEIVFEDVIGQLGRKWNDYRVYQTGRHIIYFEGDAFTASSNGTMSASERTDAITNNLLTGVGLTKVSGTGDSTVTINVEKKFGFAGNGNSVVKKFTTFTQSFEAMGYSLYDADDCKYWKLLGWDEAEQRYVTRHQTNITLDSAEPCFNNMNVLLSQFNGMLRYQNGKYSLAVKQKAPNDAHFSSFPAKVINEEDIIGAVSIDDGTSKKKLNSISANIVDPSIRFGGRAITFSNSDYVKQDRGIKKQGNYSSPGITNYFNARMAVKQQLDESRFGLTAKFTLDSAGYLLQAGDIVRINYSRFNWTNKEYRIQSLNFAANGNVQVVAREHNEDAYLIDYTEDGGDSIQLEGGSQGNTEYRAPAAPTNGTPTTDLAGRVKLTWTNGTNFEPTVHRTQIARHPTNVTPNAAGSNVTILADTQQDNYIDSAPGDFSSGDVSHYYWVRHVYSRSLGDGAAVSFNKSTAWLAVGQGTAKVTSIVEIDGGITINDGGLTLASSPTGTPAYKAGQTDYDSGTGFFLGRHSNAYKLSVGNSSGNKMTFDGTNLSVTGTITGSAFESGTLKGTHSNALPTDIFTRSTNRTRPVNSETGGFIDLTTGHFIFGNATKFIAFGPDDDGNDAVGVRGDLIADKLIANEVVETPLLKVGAIQANTIGVNELKEEVFREIDVRIGNAGGYYDSYETGVSNSDTGYLGTTGTTFVKELKGAANAGYTHKGEKTFVNFSINDAFSAPRHSSQSGRSADDLKITVTLQKADQTSGTPSYTNLASKVMTLTETVISHASSFTLSDTLSHEITVGTTGHDVDDAYFYRVVITASTSLSMFRVYAGGDNTSGANDSSGTPILFEVREGAIGTTAGNLGSSGDIIHDGDSDTKIIFNDDEIVLQAGGETMATFTESTSDTITLHKDTTISTNLTVTGDLTVAGTSTKLNTTDLNVKDKNIILNYHATADTSSTASGAGITVQDAVDASNDATILWNTTNDDWDFSHDIFVQGGFKATNNALLSRFVSGWTAGVQTHNVVYNAWTANTGDYSYLKAAGNGGSGHGIVLAADLGTFFGTTDIETGGITDSATDPLTNTWAYFKDASAYVKGDLGIGTDTPGRQLHIKDTGATVAAKVEAADGSQASLDLTNSEGAFRIISDGGELSIYDDTDTAERFRIDTAGNVGIGTNNPARKLEVDFTGTTYGARFTRSDTAGNSLIEFANNGGVKSVIGYDAGRTSFTVSTGSTPQVVVKSSTGNVGISTDTPLTPLHITEAGSGSAPSDVLTIETTRSDVGTAFTGGAIKFVNSDTNSAGQARIKVGSANHADTIGLNAEAAQSFIFETSENKTIATTNIDGNATTITVTHATYASFVVGQKIAINTGDYFGSYYIDTVVSNTQFTIADTDHDLDADTSGTPVVQFGVPKDSMIIRADGNVGIGTLAPDALLHVSSGTSTTGPTLLLEADTNNDSTNNENANPQLKFSQDGKLITADIRLSGDAENVNYGGTNNLVIEARSNASGSGVTAGNIQFATGGNADAVTGGETDGTVRLHINRIGDVGIGTTSPNTKLHVNGNVGIGTTNAPTHTLQVVGTQRIEGQLMVGNSAHNNAIGNNVALHIKNSGVGARLRIEDLDSSNTYWDLLVDQGDSFAIYEGEAEKITLKEGGNFGIDNNAPAAKFQVQDFGMGTTSTAVSTTSATVVDTFAKATFRTVKYLVQITQGTKYQSSELMSIHDGTTAIATEYAMLETDGILGTLDVAISGDNVQLKVTMAAADAATVKVVRQCIVV